MSSIPSLELVGLEVADQWKVVKLIQRPPTATGGFFSAGYLVERDKKTAYLKALDFSAAFKSADVPGTLKQLLDAFEFERSILYKCKGKRLDKIVIPIADGSVSVPGFPPYVNQVYYIIFELAKGDIRNVFATFNDIELAFIFRSLHNTSVGLKQLHTNGVAHQDLKPSNVLVYDGAYKISDLGRASDIAIPFNYDKMRIPGDMNYAPIEQFYGFEFAPGFQGKKAADAYSLGSLLLYFFTRVSTTQAFKTKATLHGTVFTDNYLSDMPILNHLFAMIVSDLEFSVGSLINSPVDIDKIINLFSSLCSPDLSRRTCLNRMDRKCDMFNLERVVSLLDQLATKAELRLI